MTQDPDLSVKRPSPLGPAVVEERWSARGRISPLLLLDFGGLASLFAAVGVLVVNLARHALGLMAGDAVLSRWLVLLTLVGVGAMMGSKCRGLRGFIHERADRKIMLAAAAVLIATGATIGLLAIGVMGDRGRMAITSNLSHASAIIAGALDKSILARAEQMRKIGQDLLPNAHSDPSGDPGAASSVDSDVLTDALDTLAARGYVIRDGQDRIVLRSGDVDPMGQGLPVQTHLPMHLWLLRDPQSLRFFLRAVMPVSTKQGPAGTLEAVVPLDSDVLAPSILQAAAAGRVEVCARQATGVDCLPGRAVEVGTQTFKDALPAALFKTAALSSGVFVDDPVGRPHITAYTPISDSGLVLALRVSGEELFGSLLDAAGEVSLALVLLVMLGLSILRWQVRPMARRLHESEHRLRSAFDYSGMGIVMFARSGKVMKVNAALVDMLGFTEAELLALSNVVDLVHPLEREKAQGVLAEAFAAGVNCAYCAQRRYLRKGGGYAVVRLHVSPVMNETGTADMAVAFVQDVSELLVKSDALRREHAFLQAVLDNMTDGVVACDETGNLRYVNGAAQLQLGYHMHPDEAAPWTRGRTLRHPDMRLVSLEDHPLQRALQGEIVQQTELLAVRHDHGVTRNLQLGSHPLRDEGGNLLGGVLISHDLTEIKASQQRVEWLAYHDALTGLPNRNLLVERLEQAVTRARNHDRPAKLAVMFLDLDRFKTVNESIGHALGDRLLVEVAKRLRVALDPSDTLARLGGDDFAVLLASVPDTEAVERAAGDLLRALSRPFMLDNHVLYTGASAGIAMYPEDGETVGALFSHADAAMYQAKLLQPGEWRFYDKTLTHEAELRLEMETALRTALESNQFELFYQPKVDVANDRIVGAEALLRWHRPEFDLVGPAAFIPLLEEMGLIVAVGAWVIKTVCAQQARWMREGHPVVPIAVNCSARQFQGRSLVELVSRALQDHNVPAHLLEIEITESILMQEPDLVSDVLGELRDMGVHASIDDFGTGYSSLSYLKRLPVSTLKIDRAFIKDLPDDEEDVAITQAILALARALQMKVVAEGVETLAQLDYLRTHGCHEYQGFYRSEPVPAEPFLALLHV